MSGLCILSPKHSVAPCDKSGGRGAFLTGFRGTHLLGFGEDDEGSSEISYFGYVGCPFCTLPSISHAFLIVRLLLADLMHEPCLHSFLFSFVW